MKKIIFLYLIIFIWGFGNLYSQTIIIRGKITPAPNPCLSNPCNPGIVYTIKTDSINYIITLQGKWVTSEPFIIESYTFEMGDTIIAEGFLSVKQDIHEKNYYEIEIISILPLFIEENTIQSCVLIFPNPSSGSITIESKNKQIKNVDLIDIKGGKVLSYQFSDYSHSINIEKNIIKGVFFIKILFADESQVVKKIITL